jgi:single-strand DNA-binding protein
MLAFGLARLGRDCELRATPQGESVGRLSLAFTWGAKGEDGKRKTVWVEASFWGKRAAALAPYLTKGSQVSVALDDVHLETYESGGVEKTKLVGKVSAIDLAGGQPAQAQRSASAPAPKPTPAPRANSGFDDMDDDIPF